jgi:hypothetical protein
MFIWLYVYEEYDVYVVMPYNLEQPSVLEQHIAYIFSGRE